MSPEFHPFELKGGQHILYGTQGKIRETKREREERGREKEEEERANQWFLQ